MKAWAFYFSSDDYHNVVCVIAESELEAKVKATHKLEESKDETDKDEDYKIQLIDFVEIPADLKVPIPKTPIGSSFDEQIRQNN